MKQPKQKETENVFVQNIMSIYNKQTESEQDKKNPLIQFLLEHIYEYKVFFQS